MGKLGWSEYEYFTCSPEGFYYACQGYFSKLQDESLAIRNCTKILFRALGGKENLDNIWPLNGKEKESEKFEEPSIEWWQRMKAKHAIIDKQINAEKWQK